MNFNDFNRRVTSTVQCPDLTPRIVNDAMFAAIRDLQESTLCSKMKATKQLPSGSYNITGGVKASGLITLTLDNRHYIDPGQEIVVSVPNPAYDGMVRVMGGGNLGETWDENKKLQYTLGILTQFLILSQGNKNWHGMTAAPNGNVYACEYGGDIYMQTGGVGAFNALAQITRNWRGMAAAPNGNVYACDYGGDIYMQTGGVGAFNALSQGNKNWYGMTAAPNGNVYASVSGGDIYMQTGGVGAFNALAQTSRNWTGMTAAPNGNVYACDYGGDIYMQNNADITSGTVTLPAMYRVKINPFFEGVDYNKDKASTDSAKVNKFKVDCLSLDSVWVVGSDGKKNRVIILTPEERQQVKDASITFSSDEYYASIDFDKNAIVLESPVDLTGKLIEYWLRYAIPYIQDANVTSVKAADGTTDITLMDSLIQTIPDRFHERLVRGVKYKIYDALSEMDPKYDGLRQKFQQEWSLIDLPFVLQEANKKVSRELVDEIVPDGVFSVR